MSWNPPRYYAQRYWADRYFDTAAGEGGTTYADMEMYGVAAASGAMALEAAAQSTAVNNSGYWGSEWRERKKTERQRDEELLRDLKRALGMLEDAPAAVAAPVVDVIAPYVEAQITTVPPAALIDWRPFVEVAQKREALRAAIAEAKALQDQEDEDLFLLLAA